VKSKHPPGKPMTLGNMRELGVQRLIRTASTMRANTNPSSARASGSQPMEKRPHRGDGA
jgi:hypothetical protein